MNAVVWSKLGVETHQLPEDKLSYLLIAQFLIFISNTNSIISGKKVVTNYCDVYFLY